VKHRDENHVEVIPQEGGRLLHRLDNGLGLERGQLQLKDWITLFNEAKAAQRNSPVAKAFANLGKQKKPKKT